MIWVIYNAWLCDDAFITLRTIDNLFHGHGLRWNTLERVQTYTHPLWMLLLAGTHALIGGELYWSAILLSLLTTALTLWLLFRYLARSNLHLLVGVLVLSFSRAFIDYSTSGLENPLAHLLLILFLVFFFRFLQPKEDCPSAEQAPEALSPQRLGLLAFLASLGVLNRMDHALLFAPPLLYAFWHTHRSWRLLGTLALATSPLWLWELFSLLYYGSFLPNTAYAKLSTGLFWDEKLAQGLFYFFYTLQFDTLTFLFLFGTLGMALAFSWRRPRRHLGVVGVGALLYLLYLLQIGGDFMAGRFLSILVVALLAILLSERLHPFAHLLPFCALLLLLQFYAHNPTHRNNKHWDGHERNAGVSDERAFYFGGTGLPYARPGKIMPDHPWRTNGVKARTTQPSVQIHGSIGMFGLYAGPHVHVIDPLALSDPLLARLPMQRHPHSLWRPGHFTRHIPAEYPKAVLNQTALSDPDLRAYEAVIRTIARAPLFSKKRWQAIWGLHTGQFEPWLRRYRQRAYHLYTEQELGHLRRTTDPFQRSHLLRLSADGAGIKLHKPSSPHDEGKLSIAVSRGIAYDIALLRKGQILQRLRFQAHGHLQEGLFFHEEKIPKHLLSSGFDAIRIFPAQPSRHAYLGHLVFWRQPLQAEIQALRYPRFPGTPWNHKNNRILGGEQGIRSLAIRLSRLEKAPKLHLSSDGNDDLKLSFFAKEKEIAHTVVNAYPARQGGLQVYAVTIPQEAQKQGFDKILVRPLAGDGAYSIGHLYLMPH
jgi:arabinofuranosyltransferase